MNMRIFLTVVLLLLMACSKTPPAPAPDPLLKAQRDVLEKARQTDQLLQDADARRRKELEDGGQ